MKHSVKKEERKKKKDYPCCLFVRQRPIAKKVALLAGASLALIMHVLFYSVFFGKMLTPLHAGQVISMRQQILPLNPIESIAPLEKISSKAGDSQSVKFRTVKLLEGNAGSPTAEPLIKEVVGNVVKFSGKSIFPDADVFLEINSERFLGKTRSDLLGNWSWTNYGNPLEDGEHSVEIYNIAPYGISGAKDFYAQKKEFLVDSAEVPSLSRLEIANGGYEEKQGDGDLGDRMISGGSPSFYSLDVFLEKGEEYYPGDELRLRMIVDPVVGAGGHNSVVKTEIYEMSQEGAGGMKILDESQDQAFLDKGVSFVKRIKLKEKLVSGEYVLVTKLNTGDDLYVQSAPIVIKDREIVRVGSMIVDESRFQKIIAFNAIFLLTLVFFVSMLILREYRRFLLYRPVGGEDLHRSHYF